MSFLSRLYGHHDGRVEHASLTEDERSGSLEETRFRLQVEGVLNDVRPMLQSDGGDIELVDVVGKSIKVRMTGACDGCASASLTLRLGIEKRLRQEIPDFEDLIPV
jgi:Fe-S cluster biogenesis protein NfuA